VQGGMPSPGIFVGVDKDLGKSVVYVPSYECRVLIRYSRLCYEPDGKLLNPGIIYIAER
jgi:hypothetical protein